MTFLNVWPLVSVLLLVGCVAGGGNSDSVLSRPNAEDAAAEPSIDFSGSAADVQKYMRLGQQAEEKNNTEVALMMYRAAADADKADPVPLLAVAKLQEAAGDSIGASQLYEAAAQKRPRDTELQLAAARNLLKQRNYKLAAQRYERLADESGDWRAYNGLGVARGFLGNDAAARAAYAKALDRTPDAAKGKVRANLALSQILAGDSRATIALLEPRQAKGNDSGQADGSNSAEETRLLALAYGFVGRVEDAQRLGLSEPPSPDVLRQLREQPDAPAVSAAPRKAVERAVEPAGDLDADAPVTIPETDQ